MDDLTLVVVVTLIAGSATGLGAIPIFFQRTVDHRTYDAGLGLAAGIMLAASVFGLIVPGLEAGTLVAVVAGVFVGGFFLLIANRLLPHLHTHFRGFKPEGGADPSSETDSRFRQALLIGTAITLHNAPEGLAIGIAFAAGLEEIAIFLAIVIAIQNVPDGFAFAIPVADAGIRPRTTLLLTVLSGAVPEVLAAVFGFLLVTIATGLFPVAAGFAAGAMLAVIFREMIPLSHGHGYADEATAAFLVGFSLIVIVDVWFAL